MVVAALLSAGMLLGSCSSSGPEDVVEEPSEVDGGEESSPPQGESEEEPPAPASDEPGEEEPAGDVATVEPPLELAGTTWTPTNFNHDPGDTGITNPIGEDVFLELAADGTLRGSTGCNEFTGTWEVTGPYYDYDEAAEAFEDRTDGQPLSITAERTTDNACEGFLGEDDVNLLGAIVATEIWWIGNDLGDQQGGITLDGEGARVYLDPA